MGELVASLNTLENPALVLADCLGFGQSEFRADGHFTYIASREGSGKIPVLAFHKLGTDEKFELTVDRFMDLLLFLHKENFHAISDLQFIRGDYTWVPAEKKIIVLGCDDAAGGSFLYATRGDNETSEFLMVDGKYEISDQSMVYYLEKYLPEENGRRNFTFYVTFDAIPFRQTGGGINPGPPYGGMFSVMDKLKYLEKNFYLGNHTLNHRYSEELNESEFREELKGFYDAMKSYGILFPSWGTVAYSFGIGEISHAREETMRNFRYRGTRIAGAFDYNGEFSYPVDSGLVNLYDISRTGVDNGSYSRLLERLENSEIFTNRRAILIDERDYPFMGDLELELKEADNYYILIGN